MKANSQLTHFLAYKYAVLPNYINKMTLSQLFLILMSVRCHECLRRSCRKLLPHNILGPQASANTKTMLGLKVADTRYMNSMFILMKFVVITDIRSDGAAAAAAAAAAAVGVPGHHCMLFPVSAL